MKSVFQLNSRRSVPVAAATAMALGATALLALGIAGASGYVAGQGVTISYEITSHFAKPPAPPNTPADDIPFALDKTALRGDGPAQPEYSLAPHAQLFKLQNNETVTVLVMQGGRIVQTYNDVFAFVIGSGEKKYANMNHTQVGPKPLVDPDAAPPPPYCYYNSNGQYICV